jgi:N-acetylmuramoyl-L-alanine amidase
MIIKTDFSPNFSPKIRPKKSIKFIIIHYTGMQSEIESINKLKDINSKVSCHYLINRKGKVTQMVKDKQVAWHAGKSKWSNFVGLNESSIGIELVNKGKEFGYQNFSKIQITKLINLCMILKKKYKIRKENFLGHSDVAPLRKLDPGEKFPWKKLSKCNFGNWYEGSLKNFQFINLKKVENLFFKNLYKIGYRYFKIRKREKSDKLIIRSFQQHYLPQNVTGKIDKKTFKISHFLANEVKLT